MKLYNLNRNVSVNNSFEARINEGAHFLNIWHYHQEFELVVILKSSGAYFIGDAINEFSENDVYLVGKNLPHMWLNEEAYFKNNRSLKAKAIAIHFEENFLGEQFFNTPEMLHIKELLGHAKFGLKFSNAKKDLIQDLELIVESVGFDKTMLLLHVLHKLSKHNESTQLASSGYVQENSAIKNGTIDHVISYLFENFKNAVTLKEISDVANMHPSAFSRLFKRTQNKTFTKFLSEIRIGYACKLLLEKNAPIASICYEVGFNNLSNFNRQFKALKHCSPKEFAAKFK